MTCQCKVTKLSSCPPKGNREGYCNSRAPHGFGQGHFWTCIATQLLPWPNLAASPLFYKCWSQELFLINTLQVKLHFRVWILENPVCSVPFPNSVCPPNPFFTEYLTNIGFKKHILDSGKYRCEKWVSICGGVRKGCPRRIPACEFLWNIKAAQFWNITIAL